MYAVCLVATISACGGGGGGDSTPTPVPPMPDPCDASITGVIWEDINANGIRDNNEANLSGVIVSLLDANDSELSNTTSTATGYQFSDLCAANYRVLVSPAGNQTVSPQNAGTDDAIDSDIEATTAQTALLSLAQSQAIIDTDAGLFDPQTRDSDNDGVVDINDAFPNDPAESVDTDGDGTGDNSDTFPSDPTEQADTDNDGTGDNADAFPMDPDEQSDADNDGTGDNADVFPADPAEQSDSDNDGTGDNGDAFPNDPAEQSDSDNDGTGDNADAFPNDPAEQTDSDGDGTGDNGDAFPNDPAEQLDSDNDGVGDNADPSPLPLAQGTMPQTFSAMFTAGDSFTTNRPLSNWGDFYARKIATSLSLTLNNQAQSGWVLEEILNGRGAINQLNGLYGVPRAADPNALHIVYGGYNDVFFRNGPSPDPFEYDVVTESAESLRSILLEIANAGGRFVVVPLLMDYGKQPSSDADSIRPQLRQRTIDFNSAAVTVVSDVIMATDMTVLTYDVFTDVEDIYANPALNGFTNLTTSCFDTRPNCVGVFWWDDAHPGDDVHQIIADGILQLLLDNS
ncbi:MAG: SdrD B-like domain-containing protein [Pseudomonadales bacterium]